MFKIRGSGGWVQNYVRSTTEKGGFTRVAERVKKVEYCLFYFHMTRFENTTLSCDLPSALFVIFPTDYIAIF
jgi:hypothetical protein